MAEPIDRRIAELAKRQRGYVTRAQLLKLGLGAEAVRYRLKSGRLLPVYTGVYAVGHLPTLPQDRAVGALIACGPRAVISHSSAAAVWAVFKRWEMPFEVTTGSARRRSGIRVHRARLERCDIRHQLGIRVTSPARTLLDVAPRMTYKALNRAVNDLRRPGHLRRHDLADLLTRCPRHPGAARLRPFVEVKDQPTRSPMEDDFLAFTERFGLPRPEINVRVAGREVDAWFPRERVIVELDGWEFHSDRLSFEGDRDHDATALALGIPTVRITRRRLLRYPEREAERLWKILKARQAA
jgi:Transcriptional regulator, AbiEi antitoxin